MRDLEAEPSGPDQKRRTLDIAAIRAQLGDLQAELAEYEELWSGPVCSFEAASLPELAVALVKARIAKGWSQRRLAALVLWPVISVTYSWELRRRPGGRACR